MLTNLAILADHYSKALEQGNPHHIGYFAHAIGVVTCPFPKGSTQQQEWSEGYQDHQQSVLDCDNAPPEERTQSRLDALAACGIPDYA